MWDFCGSYAHVQIDKWWYLHENGCARSLLPYVQSIIEGQRLAAIPMSFDAKTPKEQGQMSSVLLCILQEERLSTLPPSRSGSVESLPARTQCLLSSDSKRMSADFSELEPKMPFAPAGNAQVCTKKSLKPNRRANLTGPLTEMQC